jgi:hypothetical protein
MGMKKKIGRPPTTSERRLDELLRFIGVGTEYSDSDKQFATVLGIRERQVQRLISMGKLQGKLGVKRFRVRLHNGWVNTRRIWVTVPLPDPYGDWLGEDSGELPAPAPVEAHDDQEVEEPANVGGELPAQTPAPVENHDATKGRPRPTQKRRRRSRCLQSMPERSSRVPFASSVTARSTPRNGTCGSGARTFTLWRRTRPRAAPSIPASSSGRR